MPGESWCQPPLTHADPVIQHPTLQVSFGKGKGGLPLRLFGVMKEQGARRDTPSQAGSEEPDPAQGDSSQQRLQAQEAFVAQLKLSEYKSKVVTLEDELRTAQEDCASASDAAQQSAVEKESLVRKVTALKSGLRAVQDKRDLLDREGERLKEQVGSLSADLGKWAAQVTSLQAAKQKDENEHMRVMFAESARCAQLERNLKLAQARHSKTKLPLEEMAGLLGEDKSAWMDVLSVGRNTEVLLVAEAEALKKQMLTQTGAMSELAESNALQVKELEGEKRACKIEMLKLEYKLSTLEGEAAAAAVAAKDAAQLAACAAAQRQSRPQQQQQQQPQHPQQTSHRHPQQSSTSHWQQFQPHQQQQKTPAALRDSRGGLEAGMAWLSPREVCEDAAVRAQVMAGKTPYSTTTPTLSAPPLHRPSSLKLQPPHAHPHPHPAAANPGLPSHPHTPPFHTHNPSNAHTLSPFPTNSTAQIDLTASPHSHHIQAPPHTHSGIRPTALAAAGGGSKILSQPYQPRSGVESSEQAAAEMEGLSEGEDGGWGGGLDQLSSLLDAGFEGSDGEPENNENGHENEDDPDAALAEYEELRMGQGHPRMTGIHAPGGTGASSSSSHALPGKRRKQESSFIGRASNSGGSGTLIRDGPDGRGGNVRLLGGAGYSMGGKRVTNIDHHVTLPNKKSSAGKAACKPISSYFKKASG
ncbi:MAG: hypothetical protein WDW38_004637 [Sanguina aurantia]